MKNRTWLLCAFAFAWMALIFTSISCGEKTLTVGENAPTVKRPTSVIGISGFTFLHEETFSCGGVTNTVKIYTHDKTGLEFVLITGRYNIDSFLICRTECTQEAWDKVGYYDDRHWSGADRPIEGVAWISAKYWCQKAGDGLRLPTEAEWEFACRAGTTSLFCFGNSDSDLVDYAWFSESSGGWTHRVGQLKSNAFGLYDVHGNVSEWCQDLYRTSDDGYDTFEEMVYRGGSWRDAAREQRSAQRFWAGSNSKPSDLGFRPARSVGE